MTAPSVAGRSEAAEDARRFGFDTQTIEALEGCDAETSWTEIWPENWDVVMAFAAVHSQWRIVALANGRAHYVGLDYAGVRAGLELAGFALTPPVWEGVRIMENEARSLLNGYLG